MVNIYHQQLSYCVVQYVEKESGTATHILKVGMPLVQYVNASCLWYPRTMNSMVWRRYLYSCDTLSQGGSAAPALKGGC